jgi:hypothetical protein
MTSTGIRASSVARRESSRVGANSSFEPDSVALDPAKPAEPVFEREQSLGAGPQEFDRSHRPYWLRLPDERRGQRPRQRCHQEAAAIHVEHGRAAVRLRSRRGGGRSRLASLVDDRSEVPDLTSRFDGAGDPMRNLLLFAGRTWPFRVDDGHALFKSGERGDDGYWPDADLPREAHRAEGDVTNRVGHGFRVGSHGVSRCRTRVRLRRKAGSTPLSGRGRAVQARATPRRRASVSLGSGTRHRPQSA